MNIVLLHGLAGSKNYFAQLEHLLQNAGHHTFSFDLIGFGEHKHLGNDFTRAEHLAYIDQQVSHHFGQEKVVLVGHSMGGMLALACADTHRDRVEKIVLISTPLVDSREEIENLLLKVKSGWAYYLLTAPRLSHLACTILCQHNTMRFFEFLKPQSVSHEIFTDYRKHTFYSLDQSFREVVLNTATADILKRITIPILNIGGNRDEVFNIHVMQPNVETHVLFGGHQILLEKPDEVFSHISSFLMKT